MGALLAKSLFALAVIAAAISLTFWYARNDQASQRIAELEAQRRLLEDRLRQVESMRARLKVQRRVAEIEVTAVRLDGATPVQTLRFAEYARDGRLRPARTFEVRGHFVYVEAWVLRFDHEFVEAGDVFRGQSVALFTRIYGDAQPPSEGAALDAPDQIPEAYRDPARAEAAQFEAELWKSFWKLFEDPSLRRKYGVRVPNGNAVFAPLKKDQRYTLTLEAAGGLTLLPAVAH